MKKFTLFLLIVSLVFSFCGCSLMHDLPEETAPPEDDFLVTAYSDGREVKPLEVFVWADTWTGDGWISADGARIDSCLSTTAHNIPLIPNSKDFSFKYGTGVEFVSMTVYNGKFEKISQTDGPTPIEELESGTYYLIIEATKQGKFIISQNKYETSCYQFAYRLVIE